MDVAATHPDKFHQVGLRHLVVWLRTDNVAKLGLSFVKARQPKQRPPQYEGGFDGNPVPRNRAPDERFGFGGFAFVGQYGSKLQGSILMMRIFLQPSAERRFCVGLATD